MRLFSVALGTLLLMVFSLQAQEPEALFRKVYPLGAPGLAITPDARGAGMGDIGVASSPDSHATFHNLAKSVFSSGKGEASFNYTPWMSEVAKDMSIAYLDAFYKWEKGYVQSIGGSFRYFNIGTVKAFPIGGKEPVDIHPKEWALDIGYAVRLHPNIGVSAAIRYLNANMDYSGETYNTSCSAWMTDLSVIYQRRISLAGKESVMRTGLSLRNLGTRLSFDKGKSHLYLPASFNWGVGLETILASEWKLAAMAEVNKLMVPMMNTASTSNSTKETEGERNTQISAAKGWFTSWSDSSEGLVGELKEMSPAIGLEATYQNLLIGRMGYRYKHPSFGFGSGIYLGLGAVLDRYKLDVSYYTGGGKDNPLNHTMRFSISASY